MNYKQNIVWIDLEMTGLEPEKDHILEIATIITTKQLDIIAKGPSLIIQQPESVLDGMNEWCKNQHTQSGLCQKVRLSTTTLQQAQQETLTVIKKYCKENEAFLGGNSVWQDKAFIRLHMPELYAFLHYKIIDVSTVKELVKAWYPQSPHADFKKRENHRAMEDILASIEELRHYRQHFFIPEILTMPDDYQEE